MEYFENKTNRWVLGFLAALGVANLLAFAFLFGFHYNNDTDSFLFAIEFFKGEGNTIFPNRYLNPFYPVVASTLLQFLSAPESLIVINILFYFVLLFLTYDLVRRVFESKTVGLVAALLVVSGYPMLRYALTQVQDIGGYAWFLATIYAGWRWYEARDKRWLHLAGIAIAFGVLTKESGCMGAFFVGLLIVTARLGLKEKVISLSSVAWAPLLTIIVNSARSHDMAYNSLQWFIDNWIVFSAENYTFVRWLGVNATTFNVAWIFFCIALLQLLRKKWILPPGAMRYLLAVIPSSLSYFAWPLFIGRTVFIAAWLVIPLAAYGLVRLARHSKGLFISLTLVSVVTPYLLQSTLRYAHVFQIYDQCEKSISCSWKYFWENRQTFSKEL